MKIVLITGAHGFIGRNLSRFLYDQGYMVVGLGHGAWPELERKQWGVSYWINGEISKHNLDVLCAVVGVPELVFHLAGGSAVGPSLVAPGEDFRRSVISASELLEWARISAPEAILILASSAAVYGADHMGDINECAPLRPYSPYGYHKRMVEQLFESYGRHFDLRYAVARLFSVYGDGLRKQLLWDVCHRLLEGSSKLILGGGGHELRDWIHVSDVVRLLYRISDEASKDGFFLNGGTGIATSVFSVADHVCSAWGGNIEIGFSGSSRQGDPQSLVASTDRLAELGFTSEVDFRNGVYDYVKWFKGIRFGGK